MILFFWWIWNSWWLWIWWGLEI